MTIVRSQSNDQVSAGANILGYSNPITQVFVSGDAVALIKSDGSLVTVGNEDKGGNSAHVASKLGGNITNIFPLNGGFGAIDSNGKLTTWGSASININAYAHDSYYPEVELEAQSNVVNVFDSCFLKSNGKLVFFSFVLNYPPELNSGVTAVLISYSRPLTVLKTDGSVFSFLPSSFSATINNYPAFTEVQNQLSSDVISISSTNPSSSSQETAFAAIKSNGSVVAWGTHSYLGGSLLDMRIPVSLNGSSNTLSISVSSNRLAKNAAVKLVAVTGSLPSPLNNSTTYYIGYPTNGSGYFLSNTTDGPAIDFATASGTYNLILLNTAVDTQLQSGVVKIVSNELAFAALKADGSVVPWGCFDQGGSLNVIVGTTSDHYNMTNVASQVNNVVDIYSTEQAFAALKSNGSVVTWGRGYHGGDSSNFSSQLSSGVIKIVSIDEMFAALKSDGSVVVWGNISSTNNAAITTVLNNNVVNLYAGKVSIAAHKSDNSVVTFGKEGIIYTTIQGITQVFTSKLGDNYIGDIYVGLKADGSAFIWETFDYYNTNSYNLHLVNQDYSQIFSNNNLQGRNSPYNNITPPAINTLYFQYSSSNTLTTTRTYNNLIPIRIEASNIWLSTGTTKDSWVVIAGSPILNTLVDFYPDREVNSEYPGQFFIRKHDDGYGSYSTALFVSAELDNSTSRWVNM